MSGPKRTEPSRHVYQRAIDGDYTKAVATDIRKTFERARASLQQPSANVKPLRKAKP